MIYHQKIVVFNIHESLGCFNPGFIVVSTNPPLQNLKMNFSQRPKQPAQGTGEHQDPYRRDGDGQIRERGRY